MTPRRLINLLPFAFVVHNFEEAWAIWTPQFIVAVSLVTLLGLAAVLWRGHRRWNYVVTAFTGVLFLNVFFPHLLSAVRCGSYTPGLVSAAALILPLTSVVLWKIHKSGWFSPRRFLLTILLGGVAGIAIVSACQGIGYLASEWF